MGKNPRGAFFLGGVAVVPFPAVLYNILIMDKEKLKKVAVLAKEGALGEREVAARILEKHGVTAEELLEDKPELEPVPNIRDEIADMTDEMVIEISLGIRNNIQKAFKDIHSIISELFRK